MLLTWEDMGVEAGLSWALASVRLRIHDQSRVLSDLACAIADGGEAISHFRIIGDQTDLFGPAALPTVWRTLGEIAAGGTMTAGRISVAVTVARHGAARYPLRNTQRAA